MSLKESFKRNPFSWQGDALIPITTKIIVRQQVLQVYNSMVRQAKERYNAEINKFFEDHKDRFIEILTGESLKDLGTQDDILVYLRGRLILVSAFHIATHFLNVRPYSCKVCGNELPEPAGFHFDAPIVRVFLQHTREQNCPLYTLSEDVGMYDNDFFSRDRSTVQDNTILANMPRLVDYSDSEDEAE